MAGILHQTLTSLRDEYQASTDEVKRESILQLGERVYELIGEADSFMTGVRLHYEAEMRRRDAR